MQHNKSGELMFNPIETTRGQWKPATRSNLQGWTKSLGQRFCVLGSTICTPSLFSPSILCVGSFKTKKALNLWTKDFVHPCAQRPLHSESCCGLWFYSEFRDENDEWISKWHKIYSLAKCDPLLELSLLRTVSTYSGGSPIKLGPSWRPHLRPSRRPQLELLPFL